PAGGKPGEAGPPKSGDGAGAVKPGEGAVKLDEVEIRIDPRAEWQQIYRETWRIERDLLYDPSAHGLDLAATEKKYEPYVAGLGSRHDLSLLMGEMLGELCLGRVFVDGGDTRAQPGARRGLVGSAYDLHQDSLRTGECHSGCH